MAKIITTPLDLDPITDEAKPLSRYDFVRAVITDLSEFAQLDVREKDDMKTMREWFASWMRWRSW